MRRNAARLLAGYIFVSTPLCMLFEMSQSNDRDFMFNIFLVMKLMN